jgi:hypothetical protein
MPYESEVRDRVFILELGVPMSYHFSSGFSLNFGASFYYYFLWSSAETTFTDTGRTESHSDSRSFVSPGVSLGATFKKVRPQLTLVSVENPTKGKREWAPFIGIGFFGKWWEFGWW